VRLQFKVKMINIKVAIIFCLDFFLLGCQCFMVGTPELKIQIKYMSNQNPTKRSSHSHYHLLVFKMVFIVEHNTVNDLQELQQAITQLKRRHNCKCETQGPKILVN
jgi:hypothetical protein